MWNYLPQVNNEDANAINNYNQTLWGTSSSSSSSSDAFDDSVREHDERLQEVRRRRARRRRQNQNALTLATSVAATEMEENNRSRGSVLGRTYIFHDRMLIKEKIMKDYFGATPRWSERFFRRRYRMSRELFIYIMKSVQQHDSYFKDKKDGLGAWGVSGLQKVMASIRMLATGGTGDDSDEYMHMGESTAMESLHRFCHAVRNVFTAEFMRRPTNEDVQRIMEFNANRGFPGMLGSIDCMHWVWKNCPVGWAGRFLGSKGVPTIILEAVATYDLWIWHAFFGVPGSENDIVVLGKSDVFDEVVSGDAPLCNYVINSRDYSLGYYLADGIYPKWATLVSAIKQPKRQNERVFTTLHESVRKDIERAFGVLQARWHIVARPARKHDSVQLGHIMMTCIILHNMIVQNEGPTIGVENWRLPSTETPVERDMERDPNGIHIIINRLNARAAITNRYTNAYLVEDLIHHVYSLNAQRETLGNEPIVEDLAPTTPEQSDNNDEGEDEEED